MPTQTDNQANRAAEAKQGNPLLMGAIIAIMGLAGMGAVAYQADALIKEASIEAKALGVAQGHRQMTDSMFAELATHCSDSTETASAECKFAGGIVVGGAVRLYFPAARPTTK